VGDPVAGTAAVSGGCGQLLRAFGGQGGYRQRNPWAAAADLRQAGPHRPGRVDPLDAQQYRDSAAVTELKQFERRGDSLTIDHGWREVADATLEWLEANTGPSEPTEAVTA
jgi:hypothetical protein